jgi:hypothetical protein
MARSKTERWRQIAGFSDYDISDRGRVRSWKPVRTGSATSPKMMQTRAGTDGYIRVTLQSSKGRKSVQRVHLLVAKAFLGPAQGRLVLHKDSNKSHPQLSNLEYGSYEDNSDDKYIHGTDQAGEKNSQAELTKKQAKEIYKLKGKVTQLEIAEMYGISRQAVSDIHRGITWAKATRA